MGEGRQAEVERLRQQQREAWRRGECVPAENYLARHPKLAADPEVAVEVVYQEVVLREQAGEKPTPEEYLHRFPDLTDRLTPLFEVHRALEASSLVAGLDRLPPVPQSASQVPLQVPVSPPTPAAAGRGEVTVPGYEVVGELGRGSMGVVHKAFDPRLKRWVALKSLRDISPERLARFRTEAEALARLAHPHIVAVFGWEGAASRPVLVLEYVPGGNLDDWLAQHTPTASESAKLLAILARAVQAAHQAGVVHRDLKPGNVLLAPPVEGDAGSVAGFFPKVSDFGLASLAGSSVHTLAGTVLGTPAYMAPEQALGEPGGVGPAADVWALGVILYRCLTGQLPFQGDGVLDTLEKVKNCPPLPPRQVRPGVPAELEAVCLDCLDREPARRPPAAELARRLEQFAAVGEVEYPGKTTAWAMPHVPRSASQVPLQVPVSPPTPAAAGRGRRGLVLGLMLVGILALSSVLGPPGVRRERAPDGNPGQVPATAEPIRITTFRVLHRRIVGAGKEARTDDHGEIGKKSFEVRFNDVIQIEVGLSREAYLYLVAFNPDGKEQLLWPGRKNDQPPRVARLRYPPPDPKGRATGFCLNDEPRGGLQGVGVVASSRPLPSWNQWQSRRGPGKWGPLPRGKGVWLADADGLHRARRGIDLGDPEHRGEVVVLPGMLPLVELAHGLRAGGVDVAEVLAFPVLPRGLLKGDEQ